ncbi:acyltransferase domain-containing protein [Streptacidiphilus sp. 4-A2]|nr:acyltransferase domain-containing protein [Streptacidiphilus sp. 4-A2]
MARNARDAARALTGAEPGRLIRADRPAPVEPRETVFLFPGQGGQHVGMAEQLYRRYPGFRADIDACAELAAPALETDLRQVLFPDPERAEAVAAARRGLATMAIGQPAVFAVEYALARLWQSWGVRPGAVLGHSLGAYPAAAIAGVLSLPDAMALVLARGRLLGSVGPGAMLALPLSVEQLGPRLGAELSVAAVNGPGQCVVAGRPDAVRGLQEALAAEGVEGQLLHISTAAHSHLVEPLLADFEKQVAEVRPQPPELPWISDRSGALVSADEVTDPSFWSGHLRHTVNFSAALGTVLGSGDAALIEVGPGRTLAGLARRHPECAEDRPVVACMPHPADETDGSAVLLDAVGRLWQAGVGIDWSALHADRRPLRVPLPTYPFERRSLRIDRAPAPRPVPRAEPQPLGTPLVTQPAPQPDPQPMAQPEPRPVPRPVADAGQWATTTEQVVAAAFRSILGVERLDGHRSFFELGGDSMLASRVAAVLRRELDQPVGVRTVFRTPTVAGLAAALDQQRAAGR